MKTKNRVLSLAVLLIAAPAFAFAPFGLQRRTRSDPARSGEPRPLRHGN
jgi:hypothetical protein